MPLPRGTGRTAQKIIGLIVPTDASNGGDPMADRDSVCVGWFALLRAGQGEASGGEILDSTQPMRRMLRPYLGVITGAAGGWFAALRPNLHLRSYYCPAE